jgi:hypothetical protein
MKNKLIKFKNGEEPNIKKIEALINILKRKESVFINTKINNKNGFYKFGYADNCLYRTLILENIVIQPKSFIKGNNPIFIIKNQIRNIIKYGNPYGKNDNLKRYWLEFIDTNKIIVKDFDGFQKSIYDFKNKVNIIKRYPFYSDRNLKNFVSLISNFLLNICKNNGGNLIMNETNKKLNAEKTNEQTNVGRTVDFKFDIDCIVKDTGTQKKGRVTSLTVNKYGHKEYFVEGAGVQEWMAEKYLELLRPPSEFKMEVSDNVEIPEGKEEK